MDKLLLNLGEPENDNVNYDKNTPQMAINNPEGTGMVKDGEDEHGLQTMNRKIWAELFTICKS